MAEYQPPDRRRSGARESNTASDASPTTPEASSLPAKCWGELVLLQEIGRGSFGTVYQAHDPRLDRAVAVKLLRSSPADEQLASMLLHEGRTLARVRHPNVITVYGAGEHEGQVGLCMELVRGVTLEEMLTARGPFSDGEAGLIGQDLCRALAAVHRAGLVHGDVKAQNVMREDGGRLVLMDFGAGRTASSPGLSRWGIVGTPLYLAPELFDGAEGTVRSDIYSLGVLLFHLVTGAFPITARTIADFHAAHARGEMVRLHDLRSDLQESFVRIVERAIERDPAQRFSSAGEMEAALARVHGTIAAASTPPAVAVVDDASAADTDELVPPAFPVAGDTLTHYRIIEQVGSGGTGVVYRATDMRLKREVAIKVLRARCGSDAARLARFTQEAEAIAALSHPNILTLHDVGTEGGLCYAVTEFVHGQTLRARLVGGPIPADQAIEYAIDVAHGLAAAHAKDILHLDLKPENLMVTDDGWLKILDFGVARAGNPVRSDDTETTRPRPEQGWGTLAYMSPEQLCGESVDHRSDLFSLGTILYEMLAGRHPFQRQSTADTMGAILRDDPAPIRAANPLVSPGLERIVQRSLRRSPSERFQSAREVRFALEAVRDEGRRADTARATVARRDLPSVAVLPFSDMSPDRDQECFCEGIAEELINALTQIRGLRVAARTSAFQVQRQARDARQIGQVLNVSTVLDGSVRKHNNRLRITVQLVGAEDGYQIWSERFDREMEDVFAIQDEIAASVVQTLKGQLTTTVPLVAPHTRVLEAYTSYLEGRYHWNKRTEDELKRSVECFRDAIERDPAYAVAYAGMADAYVMLGTYGALAPGHAMPRAKRALERALGLDPALAEAYACRGCVRSVFDWSWDEAERDFLRAIDLNPAYATAHHWYAINHLVPRGRFTEAEEALRRARELDPLALSIRLSLGMTSYFAAQYDAAVDALRRTIQLDENFVVARLFLAATYAEQGRFAEALAEIDAAGRLSGRTPELLANLGYVYGRSGEQSRAREVLDELTHLSRERYVSQPRIAQVHAGLGERPEALDRLEAGAAERAADLAWIGVRPVFASLRGEPRYSALLKRMGLAASYVPGRTTQA